MNSIIANPYSDKICLCEDEIFKKKLLFDISYKHKYQEITCLRMISLLDEKRNKCLSLVDTEKISKNTYHESEDLSLDNITQYISLILKLDEDYDIKETV